MNPTGRLTERIRRTLPTRIREARQRAHLSQNEVAYELQRRGRKVSGGAVISDWERGKAFPKFATFLAFCEVVNQPPGFFFGEDYDRRPGPTQEEIIAEKVAKKVATMLEDGISQRSRKRL